MIILKAKNNLTKYEREKLEDELSGKINKCVLVIPYNLDLIYVDNEQSIGFNSKGKEVNG